MTARHGWVLMMEVGLNNLFLRSMSGVQQVLNLMDGHVRFLKVNTGVTNNPRTDLYVQNPDGVLANNRHFISDTQMEYQPNGDATTEGQSLHVLGHIYSYLASGKQEYLDDAIHYWDAYVNFYYKGQPIPETPQRWICNWLVNGKEPCLANFPINPNEPTNGGYKCVPLRFENGLAKVPHGSPFWGEYLDVVSFAHRGHMGWNSINGGVLPIIPPFDWEDVYANRITTMPNNPTDSLAWVDWVAILGEGEYKADWETNYLPTYGVEWIIAWTGNKIGILRGPDDQLWSGEILETGMLEEDYGTIQLTDTTVNGVYFVNYAVRLPVEHGGYMFARNEPWHNRPIHTPLLGVIEQMGNAADAEEWFADASYLLWRITGEERYRKAMESSLFTNYEYTQIDSQDKFFRKSKRATTPFTDGISYSYVYPDWAEHSITRSQNTGMIDMYSSGEAQLTLEQQSIWFRVNQNAVVRTSCYGSGLSGLPVSVWVDLVMSPTKRSTDTKKYRVTIPAINSSTETQYDIPIGSFCTVNKPDGDIYMTADSRSTSEWGGTTWTQEFDTNVFDGRQASVIKAVFPTDSGGFMIGAWLTDSGKIPLNSITYKSSDVIYMRIEDDNLWRWVWQLPSTNNEWVTYELKKEDMFLSGYQPSHPSDPSPEAPVFTTVEDMSFYPEDNTFNVEFTYYCVNELPERFLAEDGYTAKYIATYVCDEGFNAHVGDCTILNARDDTLMYCPGVIPFSNINVDGSETFHSWHGLPYPGYQYPLIFAIKDGYERQMGNMIDFLYDAQQFYHNTIGNLGPVASAYIWDRSDNIVYGPPDTFTMYHWGDGIAWSGYQPRAFQGGCRAWEELVFRGKPVPQKLIDYNENWIRYLINFLKTYSVTPTYFPPDGPSIGRDPTDIYAFVGHMSGLWLAGLCHAAIAGCQIPDLDWAIEQVMKEILDNYLVTDVLNHPMNGCWTPAARLSTGNGMIFGFWTGEILRGLGLYVLWKKRGVNNPAYSIPEE